MDEEKLNFIKNDFIKKLNGLTPGSVSKWGKMNAQQMVEHISGFFRVSTNKLHFPLATPPEQLPKFKEFLRSDKEFRENTKAPVLPEEPVPVQFASFEDALNDLEKELNDFLRQFAANPGLTTQHPVFGDLNFEEWVLLHYKHVIHHAKQFGLIERTNARV